MLYWQAGQNGKFASGTLLEEFFSLDEQPG
jgi:hypothetical protein